jgi:twitching motility protein PilT
MKIQELLDLVCERKASDLHLVAGFPPMIRIEGVLAPVGNTEVLTTEEVLGFLKEIVNEERLQSFWAKKELDFSLNLLGKARFRVNAYFQEGSPALSLRRIPLLIPEVSTLGLPKAITSLTNLKQGFVLVTGPTGHGKSTTLASLVNLINLTRAEHIITVEDPIEFIFPLGKSLVSQREVGSDTLMWGDALRAILREDPNVVLVGEMRDFETVSSAMTVAETGHLVFSTLHTNSAAQTVDRVIDVFPKEQQDQARAQLATTVEAVISLRLVPAINGSRALAYELMLGTTAIRTSIREGKTHLINNIITTSSELGMISLDMNLAELVKSGMITYEVAQAYSLNPTELNRLVKN